MDWLNFVQFVCILSVTSIDSVLMISEGNNNTLDEKRTNGETPSKLLVIMLDGFRWDYLERQNTELKTLRQFVSEGVQTEWVDPIFPSLSYPNWITVSTGLFAENHGILGNFMLDRGNEEIPEAEFSLLNSSSAFDHRWWKNIEPIWITAAKNNHRVLLSNWALCTDAFSKILPIKCSGYKHTKSTNRLGQNLQKAIELLNKDVSFAMVYEDLLDNVAHAYGPDSFETKSTLISIDSVLQEFETNLKESRLFHELNVIIASDHGMTNVNENSVKHIFLGDYINIENVYKIVDSGAVSSIAAIQTSKAIEELYTELTSIPGIDVYKKEDIPEELHYKNHPFVLDFLLLAKPGYYMVGVSGNKQLPSQESTSGIKPFLGNHGYCNMADMRGVFFARGPAFKTGILHTPIQIQDEYQILTKILGFLPLSHNGSWERVANMFA